MSAAAPPDVPFSGLASTGEPEAQALSEPATGLPLDSESSSTFAENLTAAVSRILSDLVESGSERATELLEQAGNLMSHLMEKAGAVLGALVEGGADDGAFKTVEHLIRGIGGVLGELSQVLGQMLGGSSGTPTPSGGPGAPPAVPPPAVPAVPSGPAPASYFSFLGASGSAADAFPLLLAVLCSLAVALLQGGKLSYLFGPGRLRSTALRLTVERPG